MSNDPTAAGPNERKIGKSPLLAMPFSGGFIDREATLEPRDESSDMAETREMHADRLFALHELTAGREPIVTEPIRKMLIEALQNYRGDLEPGEPNRGLTFKALRSANTARCPLFKNAKGETQHSGRDWSPNDWMVSTFGELGEAANVMKKVRRGDFTMHEARPKLAQEFADTIIYLDMLAAECGINLSEAIMETFNAKSAQLELPLFITEDGYVVETRK